VNVDELDHFFAPEVERLIRLRDACRRAVLHRTRCVAEVSELEAEQRQNLARPGRHEAVVRAGFAIDQRYFRSTGWPNPRRQFEA
jgi:hypothetical protein